jgi:putative ABC transport system permease protein
VHSILGDIRYAFRLLLKRPGFATIAIATIGLGIGATTMVFSLVNGVLLQPLPYPDADRLTVLGESHPELFSDNWFVSPPNLKDWQAHNRVFEGMAGWQRTSLNLTGTERPERLEVLRVSAGFFSVVGLQPMLGRGFLPEEDQPGSGKVVVLSHAFWQSRFGGEERIVGEHMILDGEPHQVVGVAARSFRFTGDVDLWAPLALAPDAWPRDLRWLGVLARLKPGVTHEQALADMSRVAALLAQAHPTENGGWQVSLKGLKEQMVSGVRPALLMLLAAVSLVLAITVANVANLLVARASARRRELAVRQALGSSRRRLLAQLLTESLVLAVCGAVVGVIVAFLGTGTVVQALTSRLPRTAEVAVSGEVSAFALLVTLASALVVGIIPALQMTRTGMAECLRASGRLTGSSGSSRLRRSLVVAEVALAMVLLVGASLLIRSLVNLLAIDPGFSADQVLTAELELAEAEYGDSGAQIWLYQQVLDRIRLIPGVEAAGTIQPMPLRGAVAPSPFLIEGKPTPGPGSQQETPFWLASPGYFEAMQIPLIRGRYLLASDTGDTPPLVVVNETFASRYLTGGNPLGQRFAFGRDPALVDSWATIVGVVGDVQHDQLTGEPGPQVYLSNLQAPFRFATLTVRSSGDPVGLGNALRAAVQGIDPDLPLSNLQPAQAIISDSLGNRRFTMVLLTAFAGIALVLAAIGVFGLVSFAAAQRLHEMGVRKALGATRSRMVGEIAGQGMVPVVIGAALGLVAALGLTRLLASQVYGVSTTDPLAFAGMTLLLLVVALIASALPAWRVSKVDPMTVLRCE